MNKDNKYIAGNDEITRLVAGLKRLNDKDSGNIKKTRLELLDHILYVNDLMSIDRRKLNKKIKEDNIPNDPIPPPLQMIEDKW